VDRFEAVEDSESPEFHETVDRMEWKEPMMTFTWISNLWIKSSRNHSLWCRIGDWPGTLEIS
jgi:hypothetical protein